MPGAIRSASIAVADLTSITAERSTQQAKKQSGAAQDFEALLIGQMLRSMREDGSGWLGTGDDDAGATAFAFGEEELAKAISKRGGLGLSKIIAAGLAAKSVQAR
jgi:Rod binding domain-containing protein